MQRRRMVRMALGKGQPKPATRAERIAVRMASLVLAFVLAWLSMGGRLGVAVVIGALTVIAYSLMWSAWVCYGRQWLARRGGSIAA